MNRKVEFHQVYVVHSQWRKGTLRGVLQAHFDIHFSSKTEPSLRISIWKLHTIILCPMQTFCQKEKMHDLVFFPREEADVRVCFFAPAQTAKDCSGAWQGPPPSPNLKIVKFSLTHEDLSFLVGAHRVSITKSMKDLRQAGWIIQEGRTLIVPQEQVWSLD